ncbi:small-subunit processome [Melampsora americana]|nr:small-subunit processome [Melampsora americana]
MLDIGAESDNDSDEQGDRSSGSSQHDSEDDSQADDLEIDLAEFVDPEEFTGIEDDLKLDALANMIDNMKSSASKRKEDHIDSDVQTLSASQNKRRRILPARTEARGENEVITGIDDDATKEKVDLASLISILPASHDVTNLKKSLRYLTKKSDKSAPLSAPLEPRLQQKIEREAAYDLTKTEMDKWNETILAARGLSGKNTDGKNRFVVPSASAPKTKELDVNRWNMHFKPTNSLESEVLNMLAVGKMTSKKLKEEEDDLLQAKGLTAEQIKERAAELKMARELMFRAERKSKRVAKIKSKAFRRIHKREKTRKSIAEQGGELDMDFLQELDDIDGGDRVKEEREKMELQRAKERVSLKHSSQGKWAKKVAGLKGLGNDASHATRERIRREELLTQKIAGQGERDGESDGSDEDSDYDSDMEVDTIKKRALNELSALDSQHSTKSEAPAKGLIGMKFMQTAMARKEREADEAEAQLRKALIDAEDGASDDSDERSGMKVQGNPGRLIFAPGNQQTAIAQQQIAEPSRASPQPDHTHVTSSNKQNARAPGPAAAIKPSVNIGSQRSVPASRTQKPSPLTSKESNPWISLEDGTGGTTSHIKTLNPKHGKDSATIVAEKAKLKALKQKRKNKTEVLNAQNEAEVAIDLDSFMAPRSIAGPSALGAMENEGKQGKEGDAIIRRDAVDGVGRSVFQQRELVSEAFADDGVVAQFEEEKRKEVESDAPQKIDVTIPGWGDWVGKGARKSKHSKKFIKKIPGIDPESRSDAKLSNVIISQKKHLKKVTKYQTKTLPFPFTSKSQHEHSLRQSVGPEFNTRLQHRHLVRPQVLSYPGQIIEPVQNPV